MIQNERENNMKNVLTLALILVATIILVSSCSQISDSFQTKSHNLAANNVVPGTNQKSEPMKEEMNNSQVKGYGSVQTDRDEFKETIVEKNTQVSSQQPLLTGSVSSKKEEQNNSLINDNNSIGNGVKGNSKEVISEYRENANISQPVNYSGNSGNSSNRVPFWLVVVCAILIPPLGVALKFGIDNRFWICLALTLCFWLPGMIYALIQVLH
jgi:uncharacterized membrane protein YqaE (UPF0057 family)